MKGQADMPVELVIAVIIMIMSTALAFLLINQSNEDKCLAELKTQTDVLQQAVYGVGLASPPTSRTVQFRPIECGGKTIEAIQFVHYEQPEYCGLCASRYGGCWQIIPYAKDNSGAAARYTPLYKSISCIDMAGNVWIQQDTSCTAPAGGEVSLLNAQPNLPGTDLSAWGIPPSAWDPATPETSTSRWGTVAISKGGNYNIKLTKSAGAIGGGEEQGIINVCVTRVT